MKVALGTIEVDDDTRKKIRKELGGKGHATRGECKEFLLAALNSDVMPNIGVEQAQPLPEPGTPDSPQVPSPYPQPGGTV